MLITQGYGDTPEGSMQLIQVYQDVALTVDESTCRVTVEDQISIMVDVDNMQIMMSE
jgi:hypothetical protein